MRGGLSVWFFSLFGMIDLAGALYCLKISSLDNVVLMVGILGSECRGGWRPANLLELSAGSAYAELLFSMLASVQTLLGLYFFGCMSVRG